MVYTWRFITRVQVYISYHLCLLRCYFFGEKSYCTLHWQDSIFLFPKEAYQSKGAETVVEVSCDFTLFTHFFPLSCTELPSPAECFYFNPDQPIWHPWTGYSSSDRNKYHRWLFLAPKCDANQRITAARGFLHPFRRATFMKQLIDWFFAGSL